MDVILAVASGASARQRDLGGGLDGVAGVTIEPLMCAIQRVASLRIVVEAPSHPAIWVVALGAITGQAPLVMLILVAARASSWRVLEGRRSMAFLARHDGVASDEGKTRDVMVEGHLPAPAGFFVTLLAAGTQLGLMGVVLLVARDTGCRELVAIKGAGVTAVAFDLGVLPA